MWTSAFLLIQGQIRTKKLYSRISDLCIFLNNCKSVPYRKGSSLARVLRSSHCCVKCHPHLVLLFISTLQVPCGPGSSEGGVTSLADGTGRQ